jgi:hypothetical protein
MGAVEIFQNGRRQKILASESNSTVNSDRVTVPVVKYISSRPFKCGWLCPLLYHVIEYVSLSNRPNPSKLRKVFYVAGSRKLFPSCFGDGRDEMARGPVRWC